MSAFMPAPCCFDHGSFAVRSEIGAPDTSHLVLSQDFFGRSGCFVVPCGKAVPGPGSEKRSTQGPAELPVEGAETVPGEAGVAGTHEAELPAGRGPAGRRRCAQRPFLSAAQCTWE